MRPTSPAPTSPVRPRRRVLALALAAALAVTGCTGALSADGGDDDEPDRPPAEPLTTWPDDDPVATTTSPAHPDVEVAVRPLLREPDGTTTLLADVTNDGSSDLRVSDVFGSDGLARALVVDPESRARHAPVSSDTRYCLCSSPGSTVQPGDTVTAYVTFADVDAAVEQVRVTLPQWRPVDEVPVRAIGGFAPRASAVTSFDTDADREVAVLGVWRTDGGLLVRVEDRNGTGESLGSGSLAEISDLAVVDPTTFRLGRVRTVDGSSVTTDAPGDLPAGESTSRDVLVAAPAGDPDTVLVRVPFTRRTLPVTVQDDAPTTALAPGRLDEPATLALEGPRTTERTPLVPLAEPADPPVAETGPAVDLPDPAGVLRSEAQPGWQVGPRAVVRAGDGRSVLYLDLARGGADRSWPSGIGARLDELALIDPAERQRLGVLDGSDGPDGSGNGTSVPRNGTRTVHVAFPPVADGSTSVTVDVPGFGAVEDVPVVDGPDRADEGDDVLASMADDTTGRLRTDVLSVGRLPDDGGTLVRIRRVNDSAPDAFEPAAGACDVSLSDPDSDRRFQPLRPCITTAWTRALGAGEALVQEVRFPNLPSDVEAVTVAQDGWFASVPVPVSGAAEPWYLDLPRRADSPEGDSLSASIGVADDLQTEVRTGDEVALNLDTDVLFAFGSAELAPEAVARLQQVGERLATEVSSGTVRVVGHTDSVGDDAANQRLSEERAQAVADVLAPILGGGVELDVEGRGASQPVADNEIDGVDNPDGRARNRRVTVTYDA